MAPEGPSERRDGVPDFNHGSEENICHDFNGCEGTFARISIKIAKGIIALVFNHGSEENICQDFKGDERSVCTDFNQDSKGNNCSRIQSLER